MALWLVLSSQEVRFDFISCKLLRPQQARVPGAKTHKRAVILLRHDMKSHAFGTCGSFCYMHVVNLSATIENEGGWDGWSHAVQRYNL